MTILFVFNARMNRQFRAEQRQEVTITEWQGNPQSYLQPWECLPLVGSQHGRTEAHGIAKDGSEVNNLEPAEFHEKRFSICLL